MEKLYFDHTLVSRSDVRYIERVTETHRPLHSEVHRAIWNSFTSDNTSFKNIRRIRKELRADSFARSSSIPPWIGRFIYSFVRRIRPLRCLELGSGMGISTLYIAAALDDNGYGNLTSVDQNQDRYLATCSLLRRFGVPNVYPIHGSFLEVLRHSEKNLPLDFVFIDGDHSLERLSLCMAALSALLAPSAHILIDDIRWSDGMASAWENLKSRKGFTASTFHRLGILRLDTD